MVTGSSPFLAFGATALTLTHHQEMGLRPHHTFGDIGCGALRGGVRIIPYLDAGKYFGLDINASCIDAAWHEIQVHGLEHKRAELLVDDGFRMRQFGARFDYAIGVSLFTHLPMNHILRCLIETAPCLAEGGQFYATFFLCEETELLSPVHQPKGGVVTNFGNATTGSYSFNPRKWMLLILFHLNRLGPVPLHGRPDRVDGWPGGHDCRTRRVGPPAQPAHGAVHEERGLSGGRNVMMNVIDGPESRVPGMCK